MSNVVRNAAVLGGLVMATAGGVALYMAGQTHDGGHPASSQMAMTQAPVPAPAPPTAAALPAAAPSAAAPPAATAPAAPATGGAVPLSSLQAAGGDTSPYTMLPPPPQDAGQDPTVWPQGVAAERFVTSVLPFTLIRDSVAYAAPTGDGPQLYPLRAGTAVASAEKSTDGKWLIAMTEDGKPAYLLTADLGPYDASKEPQSDAGPAVISGAAKVINTGMLLIDGQNVELSGVRGETGVYVSHLQGMIDTKGSTVTCEQQQRGYLCKLPGGLDVARAALFNGAAEAADDASEDYRQQSDAAKAAHRGVWH